MTGVQTCALPICFPVTIPNFNFISWKRYEVKIELSTLFNPLHPLSKMEDNPLAYGPDTEELLRRIARMHNGYLDVSYLNITSLPPLPSTVKKLVCPVTRLTHLPELPSELQKLSCGSTLITHLPGLPSGLQELYCNYTSITQLPELPSKLQKLYCESTLITQLPELPSQLEWLGCSNTQLTHLPKLPLTLKHLWCSDNPITHLPELPRGLQTLWYNNAQLTHLPELPSSLKRLSCDMNRLNHLPELPSSLQELYCSDNPLTHLPELPSNLRIFKCKSTKLSEPPDIPNVEKRFQVFEEFLTSFLPKDPDETVSTYLKRLEAWKEDRKSKSRTSGDQLAQLMFPQFDLNANRNLIATGIAASPGAAVGEIVFNSKRAFDLAKTGRKVILVRRETSPDDLVGMVAAEGILTSRGGKTSHAAVVARGMGKTAVCGTESISVDEKLLQFSVGDLIVREGDVVSIDGTTGCVYLGELPVTQSPVTSYLEGSLLPTAKDAIPVVKAVDRILQHADEIRKLYVRANADTPEDAIRAKTLGAQGIGLCRTEHMFLGERRSYVERVVLAESEVEQNSVIAEMQPLQQADFVGILKAMSGYPVTVRLLDPPLHEFLPDLATLSAEMATAEALDTTITPRDKAMFAAVKRLHEANPMLGLRGVRLGILIPELVKMQVRALVLAALEVKKAGFEPKPELMIP